MKQPGTLSAILDRLADARVLVVGDIMLDRFVYGDVHRISPESPVPVLMIDRETHMMGGAGNVVNNLYELNVKTDLVTVIGSDPEGAALRNMTALRTVDGAGILAAADRPTTIKTRYLSGNHQLLRTDFEKNHDIDVATEEKILSLIIARAPLAGAIILSDYGKGTLTEKVIRAAIDAGRKAGIPVLVDPKGIDFSRYRGASIVTPNRKELSDATRNHPTGTDGDITDAARLIIRECGIDAVVATRSKDGMAIVSGTDAPPVFLRAAAREVYDVSGAGDTVIATVAAALAAGAALEPACELANIAGGIVVGKVGTAPIRARDLMEAVEAPSGDRGVIDWHRAEEMVARWRASGLVVGFTNGCFDILHAGHVAYLQQARAQCDRLIMGLNSDASVRRLKGESRPVNPLDARAAVLLGLRSIDAVTVFGEDAADGDKPLRLIERLKPQLYFKGGDYTVETLPETPLVRGYGGDVRILTFVDGFSTTSTIEKINSPAKAA